MGTALAVMILSSRSDRLLGRRGQPEAATIGGLHWASRVCGRSASVVLALVFLLPARIEDPDAAAPTARRRADEELAAVCSEPEPA